MNSKITILLSQKLKQDGMYDFSNAIKLTEAFKSYGIDVCIVSSRAVKEGTFSGMQLCYAPEAASTLPKLSNWTVEEQKNKQERHKFLHVVPDGIELVSDPSKFIEALERMMQHLKLQSWLSTTCDPMNYVY